MGNSKLSSNTGDGRWGFEVKVTAARRGVDHANFEPYALVLVAEKAISCETNMVPYCLLLLMTFALHTSGLWWWWWWW